MFKYNKNQKKRDTIIFGENKPEYWGGISHFGDMDAKTLKKLIDLKYADPEEAQNYSPTLSEFYGFISRNNGFTVHGYVVAKERDDYRVSIEGVAGNSSDINDICAFSEFTHGADEFECSPGHQYSWWD